MIFQDLGNMVFRAVLRRPRVANYVDIIKFAILFISTTLKNSNKQKKKQHKSDLELSSWRTDS